MWGILGSLLEADRKKGTGHEWENPQVTTSRLIWGTGSKKLMSTGLLVPADTT